MKTRIIRVGSWRGIQLPKSWLKHLGEGDEVELVAEEGQLAIRPASRPRQGWDEQFRAMAERGDDPLLDEPVATQWDEAEWEW